MPESKIVNTEDLKRGLYPSVFKKIDQSDVKVNPFLAHKTFTVLSGSSTSSLLPLHGVYTNTKNLPAIGSELTYNDAKNIDGSLQSITYFSINHLFYKRKNQPSNIFGFTNLNKTKRALFETASIFSIPQKNIGDRIKHGSFNITASNSALYGTAIYGGSVYGDSTLLISSDRYGNLINSNFLTQSIVTGEQYYEGFNEYFDTSRILYKSSNISYVKGITTNSGLTQSLGYAANFAGNGYISTDINGLYNRDNDYCISMFISGANSTSNNELILTKASSSASPQYPFKLELSGSNQLIFSAAGSHEYITQITSSTSVTEWTHVVCQKTGSSLEMYLNGTLHSSISSNLLKVHASPFTASARIDNKDPLYIGGFSQTNYLEGKLDEIRIFEKALNSTKIGYLGDRSETGSLLQTKYVGNIFHEQGIGIISTPDYRFHDLINIPYTASYKSTKTINELNVITRIEKGDFNMSSNKTLTNDDDITYKSFVSSSNFSPYITTIGLYNDAGELLAIAKPAQAIRKRPDVDMNFAIQIDLDKNITFKG